MEAERAAGVAALNRRVRRRARGVGFERWRAAVAAARAGGEGVACSRVVEGGEAQEAGAGGGGGKGQRGKGLKFSSRPASVRVIHEDRC